MYAHHRLQNNRVVYVGDSSTSHKIYFNVAANVCSIMRRFNLKLFVIREMDPCVYDGDVTRLK